jgi:hypothetical protein
VRVCLECAKQNCGQAKKPAAAAHPRRIRTTAPGAGRPALPSTRTAGRCARLGELSTLAQPLLSTCYNGCISTGTGFSPVLM